MIYGFFILIRHSSNFLFHPLPNPPLCRRSRRPRGESTHPQPKPKSPWQRTGGVTKRIGICTTNYIKELFSRLVFLPHTWNDGIMEYWKVEDPVFSGGDFKEENLFHKIFFFVSRVVLPRIHWTHFHKTQDSIPARRDLRHSIIPLFQLRS